MGFSTHIPMSKPMSAGPGSTVSPGNMVLAYNRTQPGFRPENEVENLVRQYKQIAGVGNSFGPPPPRRYAGGGIVTPPDGGPSFDNKPQPVPPGYPSVDLAPTPYPGPSPAPQPVPPGNFPPPQPVPPGIFPPPTPDPFSPGRTMPDSRGLPSLGFNRPNPLDNWPPSPLAPTPGPGPTPAPQPPQRVPPFAQPPEASDFARHELGRPPLAMRGGGVAHGGGVIPAGQGNAGTIIYPGSGGYWTYNSHTGQTYFTEQGGGGGGWSEPGILPGTQNPSDDDSGPFPEFSGGTPSEGGGPPAHGGSHSSGWYPGYYGNVGPAGTPGFLQGQTQIPTFFDQQGYPYAVPVGGWRGEGGGIGGFGGMPGTGGLGGAMMNAGFGVSGGGGVGDLLRTRELRKGGVVHPGINKLRGFGSDTVPAALTPGEVVLNKAQQKAVMPRPGMSRRLRYDQLNAIGRR